jgi:hypothetical protein
VGSLSLNLSLDHLLQGLLWLPADALALVLTMLAAGCFRNVSLDGEPLRRRKAAIHHYVWRKPTMRRSSRPIAGPDRPAPITHGTGRYQA